MGFSVMFWNIENLGKNDLNAAYNRRVQTVATHIRGLNPDIVGFCEIHDKIVLRSLLTKELPNYDFSVTDGVEGIELLSGWRKGVFSQTIVTQRREFKAGNPYLRPGALVSVTHSGTVFNILFLHTDSGTRIKDYENRQTMFEKIWGLKTALDDIPLAKPVRLLVMGDLNTMGRKESGQINAVSEQTEIDDLSKDAEANGMHLLEKNRPKTFNNGRYISNLDHAIATPNLNFDLIDESQVSVGGWIDLNGTEQTDFIETVSDHCWLYLRVQ